MSIQGVVVRAERHEEVLAVQYIPGDEEREAVIRGWGNLPADVDLKRFLEPNSWLLSRDGEAVYNVTDEQFRQDFRVVLEVLSDTRVSHEPT